MDCSVGLSLVVLTVQAFLICRSSVIFERDAAAKTPVCTSPPSVGVAPLCVLDRNAECLELLKEVPGQCYRG